MGYVALPVDGCFGFGVGGVRLARVRSGATVSKTGLDLKMMPYRCVSTGRDQGLIEIVENSETVATILSESVGNVKGILTAFKAAYNNKNAMLDWLVNKAVPAGTAPTMSSLLFLAPRTVPRRVPRQSSG